ncbi:Transposable_element Tcb2 transposase [Hexamita inflata]|uniref:Transposable element Tcb2 transposase n=1 Tax=Hexamita inflata TaxID=28002 RepID=A0AA86TZ90_9EUKA|nr:Transposable element Tcb2 transposase [Hexamita inflata]
MFTKLKQLKTSLLLYLPDRKETCIKKKGNTTDQKNIQSTVKFNGGSTMFWGGIFVGGRTDLIEVQGNMDADLYIEMLRTLVLPELNTAFPNQEFIFQQDGARCHTAKKTILFLEGEGLDIIENWPPQSCDASPIEAVWSWMKLKLDATPLEERDTKEKFAQCIVDIWDQIDQVKIDHLIYSFLDRFKKIVEAEGGTYKVVNVIQAQTILEIIFNIYHKFTLHSLNELQLSLDYKSLWGVNYS